MDDPTVTPQPTTGYVVDAENVAEMARLIRQARMLSEHLGLLPASVQPAPGSRILDIACGPGEWSLEIARRFPNSQVVGVDISERMIEYARYIARDHEIPNIRFEIMDAHQPLAFSDASFDLVNARFMVGFMSIATWPQLLREGFRLLRPNSMFCSSEPESLGTTTSLALARYNLLVTEAMRRSGQCFAPFGEQYGIAAVQQRQLQEAGFQQVQQEAFIIDYSAGMPAHLATIENFQTFLKLLQPLLVRCKLATQDELDVLYARTLEEMQADDFCAAAFFQRTCGNKPA
ncbi:MAG: methyltransferase domain-containing protein [Ktedonobacteraceae bacterium]